MSPGIGRAGRPPGIQMGFLYNVEQMHVLRLCGVHITASRGRRLCGSQTSRIVRYFVNGPQPGVRRAHAQRFLECLARVVRDHLPVRESVINRAPHRTGMSSGLPVNSPARRPTDGLAAGCRIFHRAVHHIEIIAADLVAKTARAAVDDDSLFD